VNLTDNSSRDGDSLSMAARLLWLVLIIATLYLCYFHNLGAIGLWAGRAALRLDCP